ncbi:hypothetical protein Taro_052409 [Colocasia esculenta]|uniref:Uncharacterized protein n=1 Tax=Colocasia esculenta TaxID=4460 RepID=A0A843XJZ1_COLES|nr:hypothetical protein [Colocasia esculenta]
MMFWVIQNKEINLAAVMLERMKIASAQIWDTKSKLNVSLPYAHLLTKIFKHFGVDVSGAVVEKMGQSIRSRNLKKIGFSVQNGIWTKTSVAEGEAIIGDVPEIQEEAADPPAVLEVRSAAVDQAAADPAAANQAEISSSPLLEVESHPPEIQMEEAAAGVTDPLPTSIVASILREVLDSLPSSSVASKAGGLDEEEAMAPGHTEILTESIVNVEVQAATQQEVFVEVAPSQGEQSAKEPELSESAAEGHIQQIVLEEAPAQGEQENVDLNAPIQGEQVGIEEPLIENAPEADAPSQEIQPPASVLVSEGPSSSHVNIEEPVTQQSKQKRVVHRRPRKSHRKVNLKPVMELLKAQGDILSSVQTSVQGILASQASTTSELSSVRNAMKWFNKEMSDMKSMIATLSKSSGVSSAATQSRSAAVLRLLGPPAQESRPAGPSTQASGPSGPSVPASGPSGPSAVVTEGHANGKEPIEATKAPDTSTLATPTLSSPTSPSTAPPAPPILSHPQKSKIFEGIDFKTEDQWANVKGNKAQYTKYLTAKAESLTYRAHPLTLSEWFTLQHKNSWGPFILKEIRIAKNFQLYSDFCYLNKLPDNQFYQFHSAIVMLRLEQPINLPLSVDFAALKVDSPVLLPKLHSLLFDSDAGSHAFDMFAKQMGRMSAKQGRMPPFLRFIFREYHSGRISSQVLAPLISECERLSPTIWETIYKEPHLQLQAINSSLVRQAKPILSAEAFMELNSINPIQEIYVQWAARYIAFYALKQDLLDQKLFYPISLDRFLHRASFGKSTYFRFILDNDQYEEFLEEQRQLYIQRISPAMGSSFSVVLGVFRQTFEDIEIKAWTGGCFPFRLKEDQLRLGVRIREGDSTLDSEILRYCSGTGRRSPVERSSELG